MKKDVIIFGAGPAGLAAGIKLTKKNKEVVVIEKEFQVGGISKTMVYKDYHFDLGGHRFFTKSKEVNDLWEETLGSDFLTRPRLSRIYYRNKFFNYPIKPMNALMGLGIFTSFAVLFSYIWTKILPFKKEENFEEWVSNRFGKKLFNIFFKTYTEKLWGIPCTEIQAEWAAQRIKGLSLVTALKNALIPKKNGGPKTLIEEFKYPKYGPGMMYETMAKNIEKAGNQVLLKTEVTQVIHSNGVVEGAIMLDQDNNEHTYFADHFLSSMPITALVKRMLPQAPENVIDAAESLKYRSFITISVILNSPNPFPDTWIYIHSPEVRMGRIQNFKNWSPHMVPDKNKTALGLEYFCDEEDELWNMKDEDLIQIGLDELEKIKLGQRDTFVEGFVSRVPKAYPVYDSTYPENLEIIKKYLREFANLQPIGRYGMFKYNNMDHSILTGLYAAENILGADHDIWNVNTEQEYQEEKKS